MEDRPCAADHALVGADHAPDRGPLILTGMHRSGTSLTASLLASAGVQMGDKLLGPLPGNALGHFEDLGFLEFHRRALRGVGDDPDGFSARSLPTLPPDLVARADELVADRAAAGRVWGWKDPRTTLCLDFWAERLPAARFLFVFRTPADVADSLFRRGDWQFADDPIRALSLWQDYNELIVDFASLHPDRCLVVDIDDVIRNTPAVCDRIRSRLGVPLGSPGMVFREELFGKDSNPRASVIAQVLTPQVFDVHLELRRLADMTPLRPSRRKAADTVVVHSLLIREWARGSRAEAIAKEARASQAMTAAGLMRIRADLTAAAAHAENLDRERPAAADIAARGDAELLETQASNQRLTSELAAAAAQRQAVEAELLAARMATERVQAERDRAVAQTIQLEADLAALAIDRERLQQELIAARTWLSSLGSEVQRWVRDRLLTATQCERAVSRPHDQAEPLRRREAA